MMSHKGRRSNIKYLEDEGLTIALKEPNKISRQCPPKIKGKHFYNMDYLVDANLVWLTPDQIIVSGFPLDDKNCQSNIFDSQFSEDLSINYVPTILCRWLDWHSVSLIEAKSFPSLLYDHSRNDSYTEQCFFTLGKLGEGSFGSVFKVLSKENGKFYALKVSKEPFKNDTDRSYKLHEVDNHRQLSEHSNIVTLHNAWEEDRYMYMLMELCKESMVKTEALPESKCWEILTDIVLALDRIHDAGMGHFDVKLENILRGYDGLYKLTDFGLMFHLEKDKHVMPKEGDAKYLAPELLFLSRNKFTPKADIFSLGISVLELAGNLDLPSNGDEWMALRENKFPLTQTQHLSDELFYLLTKMMSSESSLRPSTKDILELPRVKALVEKRQACQTQVVCRPWTSTGLALELLPYFALWTVFAALIHLTAKQLTEQREPSPVSSEKEFILTPEKSKSHEKLYEEIELATSSRAVYTSTPFYMSREKQIDKIGDILRSWQARSSSLGSDGMGESGPSSRTLSSSSSPDYATDYGCLQSFSPDHSSAGATIPLHSDTLRITRDNIVHCPSPSIARYGISPLRVSHEMKAEYKARKLESVQRLSLAKRKLDFNDPEEGRKEKQQDVDLKHGVTYPPNHFPIVNKNSDESIFKKPKASLGGKLENVQQLSLTKRKLDFNDHEKDRNEKQQDVDLKHGVTYPTNHFPIVNKNSDESIFKKPKASLGGKLENVQQLSLTKRKLDFNDHEKDRNEKQQDVDLKHGVTYPPNHFPIVNKNSDESIFKKPKASLGGKLENVQQLSLTKRKLDFNDHEKDRNEKQQDVDLKHGVTYPTNHFPIVNKNSDESIFKKPKASLGGKLENVQQLSLTKRKLDFNDHEKDRNEKQQDVDLKHGVTYPPNHFPIVNKNSDESIFKKPKASLGGKLENVQQLSLTKRKLDFNDHEKDRNEKQQDVDLKHGVTYPPNHFPIVNKNSDESIFKKPKASLGGKLENVQRLSLTKRKLDFNDHEKDRNEKQQDVDLKHGVTYPPNHFPIVNKNSDESIFKKPKASLGGKLENVQRLSLTKRKLDFNDHEKDRNEKQQNVDLKHGVTYPPNHYPIVNKNSDESIFKKPKASLGGKRQRTMAPRNLSSSFDQDLDE